MCKFNYKNLDDLKQDLKRLELDEQVGLSDDFSVFWNPLTLENGTRSIPGSLSIRWKDLIPIPTVPQAN